MEYSKEIHYVESLAKRFSFYKKNQSEYNKLVEDKSEIDLNRILECGIIPYEKVYLQEIMSSKLTSFTISGVAESFQKKGILLRGSGVKLNRSGIALMYYYKDVWDNNNIRRRFYLIVSEAEYQASKERKPLTKKE
jgi:hypothetical protein